jgi:ketosteroid isomerase-like protein
MEKQTEVEGMATARVPLPKADRESLLDAFHAVRDALLSNDTESLRELYDEDFRSHSVRGEVEGREAVLEAFRPGGIRLEMFEIEDLAVEIRGEVGILTGLGSMSGRSDKTEFRHRVRFVDVFLRRDGRWRYHFSQSTEVVPDPSSPDQG